MVPNLMVQMKVFVLYGYIIRRFIQHVMFQLVLTSTNNVDFARQLGLLCFSCAESIPDSDAGSCR